MSVAKSTAQPGTGVNAASIHPARRSPPTIQAIPPAEHELGAGPAAALAHALHNGNTAVVTTFMNGLMSCDDPQEVAHIAAAKLQDGRNGLYYARQGSHADAEKAYLFGLARLHQQNLITAQQVIDIVKTATHPRPAEHQGDLQQAATLAASRHVLREEPQPQLPRQSQQPQQPQPRLQPRRPAVSPSSIASLALCGTALVAAGARQLLDSGSQLAPAIDGPTPVPPQIIDELARLGISLQPGEAAAPADQCLAQDDDGPDLSTTLAASRHLLREGPPTQPVAVDSTPTHQRAQQIADVFAGKGFDGKSGLLFALRNGQTAEVAAFMKRLPGLGLNRQQVAEVLAKASDGLAHAMMNGHIATVTAFMDGLKHLGLSPQQIEDIVGAGDSLYFALSEGHAAAVAAFMHGLKGLGLSPSQNFDIVLAKDADGTPGQHHAQDAATVTAFMAGLKGLGLDPEQIAYIVAACDVDGTAGFCYALQEGNALVVTAFMEGLKGLGLSLEQIAKLVAPRNPAGYSGLYLALHEGHAAAVTAFLNGLEGLGLSPRNIAEIVEAKPPGDGNGLSIARERGNVHAVKAYRDGLARLQQIDLITDGQVAGIMAAAL